MIKQIILIVTITICAATSLVDASELDENLFKALYNKDTASAEIFIEKGANDKAHRVTSDWTPLMVAAYKDQFEAVNLLIKHGADVNAIKVGGVTALMWAVDKEAYTTDTIKIVRLLISSGSDVNVKTVRDKTALSFAEERGHVILIKILKDAGARQPNHSKTNELRIKDETQNYGEEENIFIARTARYHFYFEFLQYLPLLAFFSLFLVAVYLFERIKHRTAQIGSVNIKTLALIIYSTIALMYIGLVLFDLVLLLYMHLFMPAKDIQSRFLFLSKTEFTAIKSLIKYLLFLLVPIYFLKKTQRNLFASIFAPVNMPLKKTALLSFIYVFLIASSGYLLSMVFELPNKKNTIASLAEGLMNTSPIIAITYAALMVVIVAISEEFFFRGVIYSGLKDKIGLKISAVVGAILFTVYHYSVLSTLSLYSIYFFAAGIFLTLLYEKTGSIYPSVIVHAVILLISIITV